MLLWRVGPGRAPRVESLTSVNTLERERPEAGIFFASVLIALPSFDAERLERVKKLPTTATADS
jgi:hypothetical protein